MSDLYDTMLIPADNRLSTGLTEQQLQKQIFETLVRLGGLAIRINAGAAPIQNFDKRGRKTGSKRLVSFAFWQVAGRVLRRSGVSDLLYIWRGRFYAFELKKPGKYKFGLPLAQAPTENQAAFLKAVLENGGEAYVVDDLAQVLTLFGLEYSAF